MLVCPWKAPGNHTKSKFMIALISPSFVSEQTASLAWLDKKVRPWERMFMIVITSHLLLFLSNVQELALWLTPKRDRLWSS